MRTEIKEFRLPTDLKQGDKVSYNPVLDQEVKYVLNHGDCTGGYQGIAFSGELEVGNVEDNFVVLKKNGYVYVRDMLIKQGVDHY